MLDLPIQKPIIPPKLTKVVTKKRDPKLLMIFLTGLIFLLTGVVVNNMAVENYQKLILSRFLVVEIRTAQAATTFTVNDTGDGVDATPGNGICATAGAVCTLRAAIEESNALAGTDTIGFSIGTGLQTISPASALPQITSAVIIDATSQPGFTNAPIIELNGTSAGATTSGFNLSAHSGTTIRGFIINRFGGGGIFGNASNGTFDTLYIGVNAAGDTASPNNPGTFSDREGIRNVSGTGNTYGGTTSAGKNVFGQTSSAVGAIYIGGGTNKIQNNYIGLNAAGTATTGTFAYGIRIVGGVGNIIGGDGSEYRNVITTGGGLNSNGIYLDGSTVSGTIIQGNYIGTSAAGNASLTSGIGIRIQNAANTTIGGNSAGKRNVIANTSGERIYIDTDGANSIITGNYIGTNAAGTAGLAGSDAGIRIVSTNAKQTTIGGSGNGEGNVISKGVQGIALNGSAGASVVVQGNYIGLNAMGTAAIGNTQEGIQVTGNIITQIGGNSAGARNVISSGNTGNPGIQVLSMLAPVTIQGNYIGLNAAGDAKIPNSHGIVLNSAGGSKVVVGGSGAGEGNVISGNTSSGINITGSTSTQEIIKGNKIGTGPNGTENLGNGQNGIIFASNATSNIVGGTAAGEGNIIAFNSLKGISITALTPINNKFSGNSIFSNVGLGIDLSTTGVTANDPLDADTGPNNLQNFPIVTSATNTPSQTRIAGSLDSIASQTFSIEFFSNTTCDVSGNGEGETYLGNTSVTTNGSGNTTFSADLSQAAVGKFITATATSAAGSTSEFSACGTQSQVKTADLEIPSHTVSDTTPRQNDTITFTLSAHNNGTASPTATSVSYALPANLTYVSSTPSTGSYDAGTGIWNIGSFNNGATATLSIQATVNNGIPSSHITNTATISSELGDSNSSNNANSLSIDVANADLHATSVTTDNAEPRQSEEFTYTINITNHGPDSAPNTHLTDSPPAGITFVSTTPSVGTYNSETGVWNVGTLANGVSASLAIRAKVNPNVASSTITNTATSLASDVDDNTSGNNSGSVDIRVFEADLAITTKTVDNATPRENDTIKYTITLINNGPDNAPNVTVTDTLPEGLTFVSADPSIGSYDSNTSIWTVGSLANAAGASLEIVATANTGAGGQTLTNTAQSAVSDIDDNTPANNQASVDIRVESVDLQISQFSADSTTPREQTTFTSTVSVLNNGPDDASSTELLVEIPDEIEYVSYNASQGTYDPATGIWDIGTVEDGQTLSLSTISEVKYGTGGNRVNIEASELNSEIVDTNISNNEASIELAIPPASADLEITSNTIDNNAPKEGEAVTFAVTIKNNGPDNSTVTSLVDSVPQGVSFVSSTPSVGSYNSQTGAWNIGNLDVGAQARLTIATLVNKGTGSTSITNTINSVSSDRSDPNKANNSKSAVVQVQPSKPFIVTIPGASTNGVHVDPLVRVISPFGRPVKGLGNFYPFNKKYNGGGYIAVGDVTGDGNSDIIVGEGTGKVPGQGGAQRIRVFRPNGTKFPLEFQPFDKNFDGGISVATGDVDGDGKHEIGACQATRGQAWCKVIRYNGKKEVLAFFNAFGSFNNGATIAFGDVDGDGKDEVIVGPGPTGSTQIRVYAIGTKAVSGINKGARLKPISYSAFSPKSRSGVSVSSADFDGDGKDEVVGAQLDTKEEGFIKVYRYNKQKTVLSTFRAYAKNSNTGAWVNATDIDGDSKPELISGGGDNGGAHIRGFTLKGTLKSINFFPYSAKFRGGVRFGVGVLK